MPDFNAKMHQNRFRLAYSAPPDPLAGFKGPTSKGRGREGREGEGRSTCLPPRFDNPGYGPVRGEKGGKRRGGKGGREERKGERDLAPQKKIPGAATGPASNPQQVSISSFVRTVCTTIGYTLSSFKYL